MSTIEDFRNAPAGVTATTALGSRAMKVIDGAAQRWCDQNWSYFNDEEMTQQGYTLDRPAPTTAREALDLAWELAHPVKEGQVIPEGTHLLDRLDHNEFSVYTALVGFTISAQEPLNIRTLEPLPDPEPDWLDAPAVMAGLDGWDRDRRVVFLPTVSNDRWIRPGTGSTFRWSDLRDVTPLYPKEGQ